MATKPCSACKSRFQGKAASVYSAWMENGSRLAFRCQLCMQCVWLLIAPLVKRAVARNYETGCDRCAATGPDNYGLIYLTVYLPSREPDQFELMFCSEDEDRVHHELRLISHVLPDRQPVGLRGLANTQAVTEAPW